MNSSQVDGRSKTHLAKGRGVEKRGVDDVDDDMKCEGWCGTGSTLNQPWKHENYIIFWRNKLGPEQPVPYDDASVKRYRVYTSKLNMTSKVKVI